MSRPIFSLTVRYNAYLTKVRVMTTYMHTSKAG